MLSHKLMNWKDNTHCLIYFNLHRSFSLWSMKKDPDLEKALARNRRWIVNNQIKHIILSFPEQVAPVRFIQSKFRNLDLQGKAMNWLKKYPCCYETYLNHNEYYCRLTKRMMSLIDEEEVVKESAVPLLVEKLAKLLMLCSNQRLNVVKLNELRRSFGFPDDYLMTVVANRSDLFKIVNHSGRRSGMEIHLTSWKPNLAVSALESSARTMGKDVSFSCSLPLSWVKTWERFNEFNSAPYISPYTDLSILKEGSKEMEKRVISLVHELLSLTLWKKASIIKLTHFKREFSFPEKLNVLLLKHPGIFYVSNKYQIYTVLLRECYDGSELMNKDPLVLAKDKFGELMQEGLYEFNRRRCLVNLEKKRKKQVLVRLQKQRRGSEESDEEQCSSQSGLYDPEERKRFYEALFDENPS